ncbi:MAG: hypothetical protein HYR63_29065 [Proteobacteria bacterium]|nr:hypothetical protein [Pseudomonadota bacterium]MBI3495773.1 hypothetical protein [Pseudomonadota bacterium]
MTKQLAEPKLREILADPVIQAVMRADHVDPDALRSTLQEMSQKIEPSRRRDRGSRVASGCCGGLAL